MSRLLLWGAFAAVFLSTGALLADLWPGSQTFGVKYSILIAILLGLGFVCALTWWGAVVAFEFAERKSGRTWGVAAVAGGLVIVSAIIGVSLYLRGLLIPAITR